MLPAKTVTDSGDLPAALVWLGKFPVTIQCGGIDDHMIMDMGLVYMCCDNKLVITLCKLRGKVISDPVCILRGDFARLEGLADHIDEDIFFRCLFFSGGGFVDVLACGKFIGGGFRGTFIRTDQSAAVCLFRVLCIVDPVTERLGDGLSFAAVQ